MSPAIWTSIRTAFQRILDAPAGERTALLNALDAEIRDEVRSLLEAHEESVGFIDRTPAAAEERLGAYRLREKIGEGGMGVVYRASRDDGEFHREVAIKITSGRMFAPEAERRFLHERQILAQLDHPNIVRMLDGGIDRGRRYLVMEYVDGRPIDEHCAALGQAARLTLFRQVCAAMHYAHQNLVIHRDLKPANILVTASGVAKVLDFGIAKLLDEELAAATVLQPMSLRCASPEQARGERLTAASDIYALGLLLYEMLTGRNPQEALAGETREAMLRRIGEQDPPRPGAGADLDAVVMKALERDPARRYASAAELSEEIGRYLAGEGVLARVPGVWTRVARHVRRHRAMSAMAAALALSLVAGTAAVAWQAREARLQREIAERRFAEARRLIHMVLHEVQPRLINIDGTLQPRKLLLDAASQYFEKLGAELDGNPGLAAESIVAYQILARAVGGIASANLGRLEEGERLRKKGAALAERMLQVYPDHPELLRAATRIYGDSAAVADRRRSLELAERLLRQQPESFPARDGVAFAAFQLAMSARGDEQRKLLERSLSIWEGELARYPERPELMRNAALVHKNLSGLRDHGADKELRHALKALALDQQALRKLPGSPQSMLDVAIDLSMVSTAYEHLRDAPNAFAFMQQSAELREKVAAANPDDMRALERLAYALTRAGTLAPSPEQARPLLERGLEVGRKLRSRQAWSAQTHAWQARAAIALGKLSPPSRRCELTRMADEWLRTIPGDPGLGQITPELRKAAAACR